MAKQPAQNKPLVGVWGGSSPVSPESLRKGLKFLKSRGIEVVMTAETKRFCSRKESRQRPYLAGPDIEKARAFKKLWHDARVTHIMGTRGGYGCLRLLPLLDQVKLDTKRPRHFWGFSDYTVLQNYLHSRTGFAWVHSAHVNSDSLHNPTVKEQRAWKVLETKAESRHQVRRLSEKDFSGRKLQATILGGNLTSLVSMLGTPWEPRPRKLFILFLEDLNESPYRIDRMLTQLSAAPFFKKCAAVVLGHFTECGKWRGVFETWARDKHICIYDGILSGHDRPHLPMVLGAVATLEKVDDKKSQKLAVLRLPNLKLGC